MLQFVFIEVQSFRMNISPRNMHLFSGRRVFLSRIIKSCLLIGVLPLKNLYDMDPRGVIIRPSSFSVKETIDRLEQFLRQQGATVYARINQQTEGKNIGQNLLPLEFLLFGNPKIGAPVMAEN